MKNLYFILLFLGFSLWIGAQTTTPTSNSQEVGITEGQLSVSLSGAATYSIPIAVPPGINGVVPQVGLVYNSQGGNGMAGYGWNISGVSAITRIPRTKFHDGVVGGVNLDANDRFALDGQRLILKTGTLYGAASTTYETENFSNLKITAVGVSPLGANYGPASFLVEYPDGSKAQYGLATDSQSITSWGITYWENPQGIRISYIYDLRNNSLNIKTITYGSTSTNVAINTIEFAYSTRIRPEQSYIAGQSILMNDILTGINIVGNAVGFRSYVLKPVATSLGYERLESITEKSGDGTKSYNPTVFEYEVTDDNASVSPITSRIVTTDVMPPGYDISKMPFGGYNANISGNFGSDEKSDLLLFNKDDYYRSYYCLVTDVNSSKDLLTGKRIFVGNFESIFATNWISGDLISGYKMMPNQGWCIVKTDSNTNVTTFSMYSKNNTNNNPATLEYSFNYTFPRYCWDSPGVNILSNETNKSYLSGDFNGDGISDVIIIERGTKNGGNLKPCDSNDIHYTSSFNPSSGKVYFANLDKRINSNQVNFAGTIVLPNTHSLNLNVGPIQTQCRVSTLDYNGDGKTDFLVRYKNILDIYSLDDNNQIQKIHTITLPIDSWGNITGFGGGFELGDFNGDGKTDIGPSVLSTGSSFTLVPNYNENGLGVILGKELDINNDGKTDFLNVIGTGTAPNLINFYSTVSKENLKYSQINYNTNQATIQNFTFNINNIVLSSNLRSKNQIGFIDYYYNRICYLTINKDFGREKLLKSITTGNGVKETITYSPLKDGNGVYTASVPIENYPNIHLTNAYGFQVVSKIEKQSASVYKKQLFAYYGAVSNVEGRGFLGFRSTVRTNWHDDSNPIVSSISKFDIEQRGANVENYTVLDWHEPLTSAVNHKPNTIVKEGSYSVTGSENLVATQRIVLKPNTRIQAGSAFTAKIIPDANVSPNTPTDYITKAVLTYESELSANKVFKIKNVLTNQHNKLENTKSETTTIYDAYYNPKQISTLLKEGTAVVQTTTTTLDYDDQPNGARYYIGRPTSKTQTVAVTGDATTSNELYTYTNHLLTQVQKKANNSGYVIEDNEYDNYGNITEKTITVPAVGLDPAPKPRVTNYEYNPASPYNGRFLTKSIDIQGLATIYNYNPSNGVLNFVTNPYNLTTSYLYDSWFKKKTTTDYLGKKNTYDYIRSGTINIITTTGDDGSFSSERFDDIGRKIQTYAYGINGNVDASEVNCTYDIYDRKVKVFEPNNLNQWSETKYDEYGRIKESKSYTGKTITISYTAGTLTSVVYDGTKTKTYTKNVMGNVVSLKDETPETSGTIDYTYFANGNLKTTNYDGVETKIEQDDWGRKTKLTDPSAGEYIYKYNGFGETTSESNKNGTTTYNLDDFGRLDTKTIKGKNTDSKTKYNYDDADSKLLKSSVFQDLQAGTTTTTTYSYNGSKRLYKTVEDTPSFANFTKELSFDTFGRVEYETSTASINGKSSSKKIKSTYSNGFPQQIFSTDIVPKKLWQTNTVNARGQLLTAELGNGIAITNTYDDFGYYKEFKHAKTGTNPVNIMTLTTTFDPIKGNLKTRYNSLFLWSEDFTNSYDSQDRLTSYKKNIQGDLDIQSYDGRGRITKNGVGTYNYLTTVKPYQNTSVTFDPLIPFNTESKLYYTNRGNLPDPNTKRQLDIKYNVFKSPYEIEEIGIDKISFTYNDNNDRSAMFYGSLDATILPKNRPNRKFYSADGTMEIKITPSGTEFITYIGGDGYSAPVVYKKTFNTAGNAQEQMLYLHRDYQGSILAITDTNAAVVEKRLFDAWGSLISVQNGTGVALTGLTVLDRGYTGHEHLQSVALINMNGRIYDPKLHRFLQPDNYIQDLFDTQNYNRYSYVLNNPLKYTDPDGEWLEFIAAWLFTSYANGVNQSGDQYNPTKWNSTTWTNIGLNGVSVVASGVATNYANNYITNYSKPPEIGVTANSDGGKQPVHPYVSTENSNPSKYNNQAFAYAGVITAGLVADDATIVGVFDDVLIPAVAAVGTGTWLLNNREVIVDDAREFVNAIHRSFDPQGFHYVTYTKTSLDGSKVYVGRSSGYGTPEQIVKNRDAGHHIEGYRGAVLTSSLPATRSGGYTSRLDDPSYWANRGSEQLQIEYWNARGMSGNAIWGIGINNKALSKFIEFGLRLLFE